LNSDLNLFVDHLPHPDAAAPKLVLLHGWAMHGGIFGAWTELLRPRFELFVLDLPGHGLSRDATLDLDASLNFWQSQLPPAIWCGWSLGGAFATAAALRLNSKVRGLINIASSPCFVAREDWPQGMPIAQFERFATELEQDWARVVQRFLALEAMGSTQQQQDLQALQGMVFERGQPKLEALRAGLQWLQQFDQRNTLQNLRIPSLWIAGARDRLVKPEAMRFAAERSGGHFVELHAGHAPFLHQAESMTELLLEFASAQ
jgi:pimeloyl-[acyl-carrier protein] methyl ester esterase